MIVMEITGAVFQLDPLPTEPCIAASDEQRRKKKEEVEVEVGGSRLGTRSGREITRTVAVLVPIKMSYT